MHDCRVIQIFNGYGAGNIGDELMLHGMDRQLPARFDAHMFIHQNYVEQRQPYPQRYRLHPIPIPPGSFELDGVESLPGLLAGTTAITDAEGWGWPLAFLAPRVQHFADLGLPVDAIGIGADTLTSPEGRRLFAAHFRSIRSWTVRNAASRDALLDAGVESSRIAIGADFSWLYQAPQDYAGWAADFLTSLGLRPAEPLLIVNIFWQGQGDDLPIWPQLAEALDRLHDSHGLQIAFFCNECRHPGFDRTAAETICSFMRRPATLVPNLYFAPGEAIAILRHATVTVGQRYHFCVESVLAETVPVNLGRSPKISGLCEDLGLVPCGSLQALDQDELCAAVSDAIRKRTLLISSLQAKRYLLAARAERNLDFFRQLYNNPARPSEPVSAHS